MKNIAFSISIKRGDHGDLMDELESKGIDVAGENGEYHTVITGGPLFQNPITMEVKGLKSYEKHCFLHID
jgi:diphthine-ammonia ligase